MGNSRPVTPGYVELNVGTLSHRSSPVLRTRLSLERRSTIGGLQQRDPRYPRSNKGTFYLFDLPSSFVLHVLRLVLLVRTAVSTQYLNPCYFVQKRSDLYPTHGYL